MPQHIKDIAGQTFGRWLVLSYAGDRQWLCRCSCGNEKNVLGANLRNGRSQSCGCLAEERGHAPRPDRVIDETGNQYQYLDVLWRAPIKAGAGAGADWVCRCRCGRIKVVSGKNLRNGHTTSCGCRRKELATERIRKIATGKFEEQHPRWKGDEIGYHHAHVWISRKKNKTGECSLCHEKRRTEWAYQGPVGGYSRNLDDYMEVCKPCHMELDRHPWIKR